MTMSVDLVRALSASSAGHVRPRPPLRGATTDTDTAERTSNGSVVELAARARTTADAAPRGSAERKAAGCVAVALSTTRTLAAARRALASVRPEAVRDDALAYLDRLIEQERAA